MEMEMERERRQRKREREKTFSLCSSKDLSFFPPFFSLVQSFRLKKENALSLATAAAFLWAVVGCLGCCVPARKKRNVVAYPSSALATPLAAAAPAASAPSSSSVPSAPPLARAASSGDNNRKSVATPFTDGMAAEDAEALGVSSSRPASAAGFVKVPSYKLPRFHATTAKGGRAGSSGGGKSSSSSSRGGGDASASSAAAGSSSAPVAPASAFGSGAMSRGASGDGTGPRVGAAQPASHLPEAPPPESLPNPQRLGFFAAVRRSMSRVASISSSAEREVGGGVV